MASIRFVGEFFLKRTMYGFSTKRGRGKDEVQSVQWILAVDTQTWIYLFWIHFEKPSGSRYFFFSIGQDLLVFWEALTTSIWIDCDGGLYPNSGRYSSGQPPLFLMIWLFQASFSLKRLTVGWCIVSFDAYEALLKWFECISLTRGRVFDPDLTLFIYLLWKAMMTDHAEWRRVLVKVYVVEQEQKEAVRGITREFFFFHVIPWMVRIKTCFLVCESIWYF